MKTVERDALQYVFDCRPLKNPGRIDELKEKTGIDTDVIVYIEKETNISDFLLSVQSLVGIATKEYFTKQDRYKNIHIYFGCTGGRHRSVYVAESVALFIKNTFNTPVCIEHTNLAILKTI